MEFHPKPISLREDAVVTSVSPEGSSVKTFSVLKVSSDTFLHEKIPIHLVNL